MFIINDKYYCYYINNWNILGINFKILKKFIIIIYKYIILIII